MQYRQALAAIAATVMPLAASPAAAADNFYYWVDENGVANFSQWAPANPVDNVVVEPLPAAQQPAYDPEEDRYAIAATQASIQSLRDEMQQRREDAREQRTSNQPTVIYQPIETNAYPYWYPGYLPRPPRPRPPGGHPRPEPRPVTSVPFRPPGT